MKDLKGTKTEGNLKEAFAGESQAHAKYLYFASVAKKEGFEQIAAFFEETALNEYEHAKLHFKNLDGIGTTAENLEEAASGENYEWSNMYPRMAKEAREEGFDAIARTFEGIAEVESKHEKRYLKLLSNLKENSVFEKDESVEWKCRNCGYLHTGTCALQKCPVCLHPQSYFEVHCKNY